MYYNILNYEQYFMKYKTTCQEALYKKWYMNYILGTINKSKFKCKSYRQSTETEYPTEEIKLNKPFYIS